MARTAFQSSPAISGEQRKFINPTQGFVGANVFGPDGKPTAIAVEPGGEVWLTPEEERMTAEAPRYAHDNPFVKEWQEAINYDSFGEASEFATRQGILVLADEPPRPVASDRFVPERSEEPVEAPTAVTDLNNLSADELQVLLDQRRAAETATEPEPEPETVKGADVPEPTEPPVQGQPSPDEIVGTPEAVAANDEAIAQRKPTREQPTSGGIPT